MNIRKMEGMEKRKLRARMIEIYGGQWRFANAINEHESMVSKILLGRRELSPEKRKVWAKALDIKESEILKGLNDG